jgi:hypothetical protein
MNAEQAIRAEIDNYSDSLFAIIGFMNLYRFDDKTRQMRGDVLLFQGRRLTPSPEKSKNANGETVDYVTPDLGILLPGDKGVLGEVKRSFPRDTKYWMDDFQQLMAYDDDLTGWPNASKRVAGHDIVLLLHYSRAVAVKDYYEKHSTDAIRFTRPFAIVEFNRSSQAQEFFSFRCIMGNVSDSYLAERLRLSISVPLEMYVLQYDTVKLYDCAPPLPYLLELIWTHVLALKVSNTPGYRMPAKNQKVKVELTPSEIAESLETHFTFRRLHQGHADALQPQVLKGSLVRDACAALVKFGDASWIDGTKTKLIVNFVKREKVLDYFVSQCTKDPQNNGQMELFKAKGSGKPPAPGPPSQSAGQTNTTSP